MRTVSMKLRSRHFLKLLLLAAVFAAGAKSFDGYFDSYGLISWDDERAHLLNFEKHLINNPDMIGYIGFHWRDKRDFRE